MPASERNASDDHRERLTGSLRRFAEESARLTAVFGDAHGLYTLDLTALAVITEAAEAGRPLGPARLADALHLSPSATTTLIDRLEQAGHLARRPDAGDRRRTVLEMQPQALEVASAFFEPLSRALDAVMDHYPAEQLAVIADFLREAVQATVNTTSSLATVDRSTTENPIPPNTRPVSGASARHDRSSVTDQAIRRSDRRGRSELHRHPPG